MRNNILAVLALILFTFTFLASCNETGSGIMETQERQVSGFNEIAAYGIGEINIFSAEDYKVIVTTDSNIINDIGIKTNDSVLHIENNKKNYNPTKLLIDVYLPEIKAASLKGSGIININNGNGKDLKINLSGAGVINTENYQAENINVSISGSGNIKVNLTENLTVNISGSGNFNAYNNPFKNADVSISGSGDIKIWAENKITGSISGSGNILYKGNPSVNVNKSGIGKIEQIQ